MTMKIYLYVMKTLSPLIVAKEHTKTGPYSYTDKIPGSSIGGALSRVLGINKSRVINGEFIVSDAYPIGVHNNNLEPSIPAPFPCIKPKVKEEYDKVFNKEEYDLICLYPSIVREIVGKKTFNDIVNILKQKIREFNMFLLEKIDFTIFETSKIVFGTPVIITHHQKIMIKQNKELEITYCKSVEPRTESCDSVAISPWTRKASPGLLFTYEAIASYQLFWGIILSSHDLAEKQLSLSIGLGKSRGFGKVRIIYRKVGEQVKSDSDTGLLLTPIPTFLLNNKIIIIPGEKNISIISRWSGKQKPGATTTAIKPGAIVKIENNDMNTPTLINAPWGITEFFTINTYVELGLLKNIKDQIPILAGRL